MYQRHQRPCTQQVPMLQKGNEPAKPEKERKKGKRKIEKGNEKETET